MHCYGGSFALCTPPSGINCVVVFLIFIYIFISVVIFTIIIITIVIIIDILCVLQGKLLINCFCKNQNLFSS